MAMQAHSPGEKGFHCTRCGALAKQAPSGRDDEWVHDDPNTTCRGKEQ